MTFRVGQKVVCVDISPTDKGHLVSELTLNRVYTIAAITRTDCRGQVGIKLIGVTPPRALPDHFDSYRGSRFRPIVERKTDISIFTSMLNPSKVEA